MKKLLVLGLCICSLSFASSNLENCKGYDEERLIINEFIPQYENKLSNFLRNPSIEILEECKEEIRKGNNLVDHMMYYHHNELDVTFEFIIKKIKQSLINTELEFVRLEKGLFNEQQ